MARAVTPDIWYEALASELGIILQTDDPQSVVWRLEALRKELNDPDLAMIRVLPSPVNPTKEIWLVKRSASNETQRGLPAGKGDVEPAEG